jgi:hypothetical protein
VSAANVASAVARGLSVVQGDADADLGDYPDAAFDMVILSDALQAMRTALSAFERAVARRDPAGRLAATARFYDSMLGGCDSAVIADLVDITRLHTADAAQRVPHLAFQPDQMSDQPVLPMSEVVTSYYLRLRVADQAGVLARVTGLLADAGISVDAMLQREAGEGEKQTDLIILTHDVREGTMDAALAQMQALPTVLAPITRIRKEELA